MFCSPLDLYHPHFQSLPRWLIKMTEQICPRMHHKLFHCARIAHLQFFFNTRISFELLNMNYIKSKHAPEMQWGVNVLETLMFQLFFFSKMQSCQQEIDVLLLILAVGPSALYQLCFLSLTPRFYLGLMPDLPAHCYIITWFTPLSTGITITFMLSTFCRNYLPLRCSWIPQRN